MNFCMVVLFIALAWAIDPDRQPYFVRHLYLRRVALVGAFLARECA